MVAAVVTTISLAGGVEPSEPGDGPALTLEMGWLSWLSTSLRMLEMAAIVVSGG